MSLPAPERALAKPSGYPTYQEIVSYLAQCAGLFPELCRVYPIGRSYQGREILCCELTAAASGPAAGKPAYHIDANHHAGEVTGCATALYTIWYLLSRYGSDPEVRRLLDEGAFYVIPRVAVDGSELYLTTPHSLRSSVRPYPEAEDRPGLHPADIDGDGQILAMRVPDPHGSWRVSADDDRLMVRRRPGESGGAYYRIYTEGLIKDYNGVEVEAAPPRWGLDYNRNYPGTWAPEHVQRGAGEFPASEPETRTIVEFMARHPNIFAAMSHHTMGGMILRPHCTKPDERLPGADLAALKVLGELGLETMGYPTWSIYEEFTVDRDRPPVGSWMDWAYDLLGTLPLATELWDMAGHAGLPKRKPKETMALPSEQREADQLALLRWNDRALAGRGFFRWRPFQHPQLGPVDLGGWNPKFVYQNPPPELLEGECHKATVFTLQHAAMAPRLRVTAFSAEELGPATGAAAAGGGQAGPTGPGPRLYRVRAVLHNQGYLPTYITQQARQTGIARPLRVRLAAAGPGDGPANPPGPFRVVAGRADQEIEHLPGHGGATFAFGYSTPNSQRLLEWVVAAAPGTRLVLTASSPKCGVTQGQIVL